MSRGSQRIDQVQKATTSQLAREQRPVDFNLLGVLRADSGYRDPESPLNRRQSSKQYLVESRDILRCTASMPQDQQPSVNVLVGRILMLNVDAGWSDSSGHRLAHSSMSSA